MDGTDDPDNLIKLTYREHYLCHALLALAFPKSKKLGRPINCFRKCAKNSKLYESLAHHKHSEETKSKISSSNKGKPRKRKVPMTKEEREKRAELCRKRVWSDESREKLRQKALANPTIHFALEVANSRDRTGAKNPRANQEVWEQEEYLKQVWLENGKCGARKLFSLTNIGKSYQSLKSILKKFREEDDIV